MLRFIPAQDLPRQPRLAESMFRDRALQFRDRLQWDVTVNRDGAETDQYDALQPLYVIWEKPDGTHGGSMRFLPTTGRTMAAEHFLHLSDGVAIKSPFIWECTRFCLAPDAAPKVSAALMLAGLDLGLVSGLSHAVGVFDARMVRLYRRLGWSPAVLGTDGRGREAISVGLWDFHPRYRPGLLRRAEVSSEAMDHWRRRSNLGSLPKVAA